MVVTQSEGTPGHIHYFGTTAMYKYKKKPLKTFELFKHLLFSLFSLYCHQLLTIFGLLNYPMKQAI